jgi:very-short-patch-repair endonuclease
MSYAPPLSWKTTHSHVIEARARAMRFAQTPTEQALFRQLRGEKLGVVVRRQYVVGRYIADFAVPALRLVIEVDGAYHARRRAADARRDRELGRRGWRVLRLPAELVAEDLGEAVARVRAALGG